jgi:hypothetical protein
LQNHLDILNSNILLALFVSNVSHANDNFGWKEILILYSMSIIRKCSKIVKLMVIYMNFMIKEKGLELKFQSHSWKVKKLLFLNEIDCSRLKMDGNDKKLISERKKGKTSENIYCILLLEKPKI